MTMIFPYAPNVVGGKPTQATPSTAWKIVASDGSTYASLALLVAAGKFPWPNLDPGQFVQSLALRSMAVGGLTDGSPFLFSINPAAAPAAVTDGALVSGSGQTFVSPGQVWQIWLQATAAGDIIELLGRY